MTDFEAAVEWLVQSGRCASKGAARRRLIEQATTAELDGSILGEVLKDNPEGVFVAPRLGIGLAGARPAGLNSIVPGAGEAAQAGIDLLNRAISQAGKDAGRAINGISLQPKQNVPKRPWWKRIFGA